ncbi:hypothetical protein [Chryseolinea soli]|nr:hypothetical protein [Chryseolinea soli]
MKTCGKLFGVMLSIVLASCSLSKDEGSILVSSYSNDFAVSQDDWQVDFSDFPAGEGDSTFYELKFAYTDRPASTGTGKSVMLSGFNHSDDLFMFMKKKLTGLSPNTDYTVVFEVELASNAPSGYSGVGGSPGEGVFLKAGASGMEPKKVIESNQYTFNLDKGNQSNSGLMATVLGNIATPEQSTEYALITRTNASANAAPFIARSNGDGEIWLFVGTDSGFEGVTTVYYTRVNVVFSTVVK